MGDIKRFDKDLSDRFDDPARIIMVNWLSTWCDNVRDNPADNWKKPDMECDNYYHELQIVRGWRQWNNPPRSIRIWGRKVKYVSLHLISTLTHNKPVMFWALSNDAKAVAGLSAEKLINRPQQCITSNKTDTGQEWVWDIPISEWNIHKLEVK